MFFIPVDFRPMRKGTDEMKSKYFKSNDEYSTSVSLVIVNDNADIIDGTEYKKNRLKNIPTH